MCTGVCARVFVCERPSGAIVLVREDSVRAKTAIVILVCLYIALLCWFLDSSSGTVRDRK